MGWRLHAWVMSKHYRLSSRVAYATRQVKNKREPELQQSKEQGERTYPSRQAVAT
jgi:hypothetical protein